MKKKIAIVGSGKTTLDHAKFIDSCDLVVRFNEWKNYGSSGNKVDILCINNTGSSVDRINSNKSILKSPFYSSVSELWFPRDKSVHEKNSNGDFTDKSKSIIEANELFDRKTFYFSSDVNSFTFWILRKTWGKGLKKMKSPSTGFLGIVYVLSGYRFLDYDKYIFGFQFRGTDSHDWNTEKELVRIFSKKIPEFHLL